jgi:hypothetical protein
MYALYALVGALACDLFVRAGQRPTRGTLALAAAAAWLLPATHPYGGILLAVEGIVALVAWRGRPPRAVLWAAAIAASAAIFLISDYRLTRRFNVGSHGRRAVATPSQALDQLTSAARGFAGGASLIALCFVVLAAVGLGWCVSHQRAFGAVAVLWLLAPPLLTLVARSPSVPSVKSEPRHLVSALAAWAVLAALGTRTLASLLPPPGRLAVFGSVAIVALASPVETRDIRTDVPYWSHVGSSESLAGPAAWVNAHASVHGILYPYSVVYLRTLDIAGSSTSLPRAESRPMLAALRRAHYPLSGVTVAIPIDGSHVETTKLRADLGTDTSIGVFRDWLVLHDPVQLKSSHAAVCRLTIMLAAARTTLLPSAEAHHELGLYLSVDTNALRATNASC